MDVDDEAQQSKIDGKALAAVEPTPGKRTSAEPPLTPGHDVGSSDEAADEGDSKRASKRAKQNGSESISTRPIQQSKLEQTGPHLKKILKYCQEIVTKRHDSDDNVMGKVLLYGQDFKAMGLSVIDKSEEWFCVDENVRSHSPDPDEILARDQRQLFYDLFDHHRKSTQDGGELMCGIGIARQYVVDESDNWKKVWHPIILIHMHIEERNGRMLLSPSTMHEPALWSMSSFCQEEDKQNLVRDLETKFQQHLKDLDNKQLQLSPFSKASYEDFLNHFRRCWRGEMKTVDDKPDRDDSKDEGKYWDQLKGKKLDIIDEWVLFSQAGDLSNSKKDIQNFIRCVEDRPEVIPPWTAFLARKLVDVNTPRPCPPETACPKVDEVLFPLDWNDQQQEIANLLQWSHTVVVQGPPGTGKTHTLANLVSNAVSQGRRVLVVSTGQHALEVFLDKLPPFIRSIAMFLSDGSQGQEQSQFIKAVEKVRKIADASRVPSWGVQKQSDREFAEEKLAENRKKKERIEAELRCRAELVLLPLAQPFISPTAMPKELKEAAVLRDKIRSSISADVVRKKNLLSLLVGVCSCKDGPEPDWLADMAESEQAALRRVLVDEILPVLARVFARDLYKDFKSTQQFILKFTEELIEAEIQNHIAESSRRTPGVSTVANQFLEQLKAGQGKGRGHQARHWKLAKEILAQDQMLVKAFPLWTMTTSLVSELLPSCFGLFDLVAIDEASKSEISELPALLRADKVLIIGDNKQVSPNDVNTKEGRLHELERKRKDITSSIALQCAFEPGKSIFDLFHGLHVDDVKVLREHFRCTQPIIKFCNDNFYNGELEPLRMSTRGKRLVPQIKCNDNPADDAAGEKGMDSVVFDAQEKQRIDDLQQSLERMKNDQLKDMCSVRHPH